MPTAVNIELKALGDGVLPYSNALYIHGLFYRMIKPGSVEVAAKLHNIEGIKPYTLSMLQGQKNAAWELQFYRDSVYKFRATFLNDNYFIPFFESILIYSKNQKVLNIGGLEFTVQSINLERNESFDDILLSQVKEYKQFTLYFLSPTSFRVKGRNYLFPDVEHVFRSYMNKWNEYCPPGLAIDVTRVEDISLACFPVRYNLNTEIFDMGNYKVAGFRGSCTYEVEPKAEKETRLIIDCLLRFSRYSGTGYKTTMGMGQTSVVR